jgi:hypothetical protein
VKHKLAAVSFLILSACIDSARFEVPQPEGVQDEKSVPKKLFGKYLSTSDSSVLTINEYSIIKEKQTIEKGLKSILDSSERVMHDTSFTRIEFNLSLRLTFVRRQIQRGDSVFIHTNSVDTLYLRNNRFVIRKFKGYFFLSKRIFSDSWQVRKLEKIKGGIIIGEIATKQELNELRAITEVHDSTNTFKPTKQQFKKILQQDGFKSEEKFLRIE